MPEFPALHAAPFFGSLAGFDSHTACPQPHGCSAIAPVPDDGDEWVAASRQ
jgi:hypothetical protein